MVEARETTVDTPNGSHLVRIAGSGPPVMIVPGGPGWGAEYMVESLIAALGRSHQLVLLDQRGTGLSPVGTGPLTVEAYVDDMAAIADQLGLDRPSLLGHSFGGLQVLLFAITHPDRVSRVIIADGDPPTRQLWERANAPESPFAQRIRPEDTAAIAAITADPDWIDHQDMVDRYLIAAYRPLYASPDVAPTIRHGMDGARFAQLQRTTKAVRDALGDWDITGDLKNLQIPVLLVYCRESIHVADTPETFSQLLPNADLVSGSTEATHRLSKTRRHSRWRHVRSWMARWSGGTGSS